MHFLWPCLCKHGIELRCAVFFSRCITLIYLFCLFISLIGHSRGLSRSSIDHHPLPEEADDDQTHQRYLHDLREAVSVHNRYLGLYCA